MLCSFLSCVSLVLLCHGVSVVSADDMCYTSGSVAGIVIATVVVTVVMGGLAAAIIWYLWKQRKGVCLEDKEGYQKSIPCPPMTPDKQLIVRQANDYAFDNPYFRDDEVDNHTPDAAEKGESGFQADNGDIASAQNAKTNGAQKTKKNRPFSGLPFHAVFHPSGKRQKATMDDTYISKHLERVTVPLRGHDFTGLGFNICGNMRDGIFVKDVLHRGPASESGQIKSGDRIVGVTVSFGAMVFEDALTILSYASPYDVKLEIEKGVASEPPSSSPGGRRLAGASTSFRSWGKQRRLFHPLYRSQSIDDLTQIGKDSFVGANQNSDSPRVSSGSTPKRSQSIEAGSGGSKTRAGFVLKTADDASPKPPLGSEKGSRKSSTSSNESGNKNTPATILDEKKKQAPNTEECKKTEAKSSRFRVEQIHTKTEAEPTPSVGPPPAKPARDGTTPATTKQPNEDDEEGATVAKIELEEADDDRPTAPPRKAGTPAKRRAPAPPPTPKTETAAVVHRADDIALENKTKESELSEVPLNEAAFVFVTKGVTKNENSVTSRISSDSGQSQEEEPSSPSKRKASSLGDLTRLDQEANKNSSTSSAILERAVSLDLQQSLPGENLMRQKKLLRAPSFEDYEEDREDDHLSEDPPELKRWEEGLDKVLGGLTNGEKLVSSSLEEVVNGLHQDEDTMKDENATLDFDFPDTLVSSTPKITEVKSFLKLDDDSLDDVPYMASAKIPEEPPPRQTKSSGGGFSPVMVSIPVIKPDLTHFEKLPSPPPASTHPTLDPSWRIANARQLEDRSALERISVQSLCRPIFSKQAVEEDKLVNGNDSESSVTSEHYSTALETSLDGTGGSSSTTTLSVTVAKAPIGAAGFAKTLIVPGPNEVDDLLSLATDEPILSLEPSPKRE